jgi:hypothetical protein
MLTNKYSSTRNSRIERLWVEVGTQFVRRWRAFFTRLGRLHSLNRKNPAHLWLLHLLFLDAINKDCQQFQADWNAHPISGPGTNDKSPAVSQIDTDTKRDLTHMTIQDLRFLGQTEHGIYDNDPMDTVHPDTINRYYGVDGPEQTRRLGQTGAGHAADEGSDLEPLDSGSEDSEENNDSDIDAEWTELQHEIARDQAHNIRHEPIKVARHRNPFPTQAAEDEFHNILKIVVEQGVIPEGFGVCPDEWEDGYPEQETIKTGLRGKGLEITLPEAVWFPRAILWAQALDVMSRLVDTRCD